MTRELTPEDEASMLADRLRLYRLAKQGAYALRERLDARGRVWTAGTGVLRVREPQAQLSLADANRAVTTRDGGGC